MHKNTSVLLAACLLSSACASADSLKNDPPKEAGEVDVVLRPLPARTTVGQSVVEVSHPRDPELTTLGGSGGPILEVSARARAGALVTGTIQAIWLYAKAREGRVPDLSVWSKTGVSSYTKCRYEQVGRNYCPSWCQHYEVDERGISPVGDRKAEDTCDN